jgi:hypothetical protein
MMLGLWREKLKRNRGLEIKRAEYDGLNAKWQLLVFAVVVLAIFSRSPGLFTHAQFFAEDGKIWFADAYNSGAIHSLMKPQVGYFSVVERLGAAASLLVPLKFSPLVMALLGTLVQWLPIAILLSTRCRRLAPFGTRIAFAAVYLEIPNAGEIHVVITNAMWHLALAAILLALSLPPKGWPGRLFDCAVILLAGLSGPFCILFTPLVAIFWWRHRQSWSLVILAVSGLSMAVQLFSLAHYGGGRIVRALGATPELFVRIVAGNVFAGAIFGGHRFAVLVPLALLLLIFVVGVGICLYCFRHASLELKLVLIYCFALLLAGLRSPLIGQPGPLWETLANTGGSRYWFFGALAFVWASIWCALHAQARPFRLVGSLVLVSMSVGLVTGWRYKEYPDEHFDAYALKVQNARPGEHVVIPIVPVPWTMELVKK